VELPLACSVSHGLRLIHGNMELQAHRWLFPQAGQPSQRLPVANIPIIRELVQTQQTILKDDHQFNPTIVGDSELYKEELTGEVLQASRTLMCAPLIVKGEVIGMLVLGHHKPNYWGEETKELVQAFANQAAVAIVNAELYKKAGESHARRTYPIDLRAARLGEPVAIQRHNV